MKLLNTLTQDKGPARIAKQGGFTFIELLIAVAILAFIGVIGSIIGIDAYQRYLFRSDLDTAASLLSKARSSAIHSIGETSHGVYFGPDEPDHFLLFRGADYLSRDTDFDFLVEKSKVTTVSGPDEVVFNPPSGQTGESAVMTLTLTNGIQDFVITINPEGGLDW